MFRKLRGKIVEVCGSQEAFAKAMGVCLSSVNQRLNGKSAWTVPEVIKACDILGIDYQNAWEYFF